MPHIRTETLYYFDELSEKAKEVALAAHRDYNTRDNWWDAVYDDADEVAKALGIELDRKRGDGPAIYFSGFCCQGDGACFEGTLRYDPEAPKKIRSHAPQDEDLHRIADDLAKLGAKFSGLHARVKHSGRYYHKYSVDIDVTADEAHEDLPSDVVKEVEELLQDFMQWIYDQLGKENDYLTSDDAIADGLIANQVEFHENGRDA